MANSKNTIQNIPLLGQLCLNTLKTDVTQFTGYNEKNSTVFGGELAPIWTKETELGNKNSTYTIFNSKGKAFTFGLNSITNKLSVTSNGNTIASIENFPININLTQFLKDKLNVDISWAAAFPVKHHHSAYQIYSIAFGIFYLKKEDNNLYFTRVNTDLSTGIGTPQAITLPALPSGTYYGESSIILPNYNGSRIESVTFASAAELNSGIQIACVKMIFNTGVTAITASYPGSFTESSYSPDFFLTISASTNNVSFVKNNLFLTRNDILNSCANYNFSTTNNNWTRGSYTDRYYLMDTGNAIVLSNMSTATTALVSPYTAITSGYASNYNLRTQACISKGDATYHTFTTGRSNDNNIIPGYLSWAYNTLKHMRNQVYTINGNIASLVAGGIPVTEPLSISNNFVSLGHTRANSSGSCGIFSYKKNDDNYYFSGVLSYTISNIKNLVKSLIIDDRYILCFNEDNTSSQLIYDMETESFIEDSIYVGYIFTALPSIKSPSDSEITANGIPMKGIIFGGGYNAGFEINKAKFTGYLANPSLMTGIYGDFWDWFETIPKSIQSYCTISSAVQSAEYNGTDPMYTGTYYPVDSSANVVLPYNLQAKVISGYTNNDMILSGSTAYPLIYYNNTQKIYSYYLLSAMENIQNTFALQGQRYAVDENNIYSLSFEGGIISNVIAVAYKKNMEYLGALPTRAIFYSHFNKTFYQFTGDAILSKLFEASDINKILFVNQNPSSLSLWISTDKGIYILSDTDMFKLDYIAKDIYFVPEKALIITEGSTNNIENDIALWKVDNDMTEVPIKLATKYYGLGSELKAGYDCWYLRLHNKDHKAGKLKMKINTITDSTFQTEDKIEVIEPSKYDSNDMYYVKFQPQFQSAVATQLELESDIAIYQISLGVNQNDVVAQQSKFNF